MKTYEVIRDCAGFLGKRWRKDETVEVEDDVCPPHHFRLITGPKKEPKPEKVVPAAFSQMHKTVTPKSGFAYKAEEAKTVAPKTRGRKKKN